MEKYRPFRFWCQKVLPLVYDDSLSYYEVLCKVVDYLNNMIKNVADNTANIERLKNDLAALRRYVDNYFNNLDIQSEVNEYIESLISSGEFEGILRNALVGTLVNESLYAPYAQILPQDVRIFDSGLYVQGFAVGELNNRKVSLSCFTDNTPAGTGNILSFNYFDTGELIGRYNVPSGHCNSATFSPESGTFFVATGGGNSNLKTVIEVNPEGAILSTHEFEYAPWGITYSNEKFYVLTSGNILIECDSAFNEIRRTNIVTDSEFVYQGAFSDDLYLYLPHGNTIINPGNNINRNMIGVYNLDGTFYKTIESFFPLEIEEGAIVDGVCYINSNTNNINLIVKCDLYEQERVGYLGGSRVLDIVNVIQSLYIDETYAGYKMDGTTGAPLSSLHFWPYFIRTTTGRVNLNLRSDCPTHVLAMFTNCPFTVVVNGNNHIVKRVNWMGCNYLALNRVVIAGETDQVSCHVTVTRFYASNLTFGSADDGITPSRLFEMLNGGFEIDGVTINQTARITFYMNGNGYLRNIVCNIEQINRVFFAGVIDVDDTFPYLKLQGANIYGMTYKPEFTLTTDADVKSLFFPAVLNVRPNTITLSNLPEGFTSATVTAIIVEGITRTKALVTVINQSGEITRFYNYNS